MKLSEATVIAIQAAPEGVQPTVKERDGFFHVTFARDDKAGAVSVTMKTSVTTEQFEGACVKAATAFAGLPNPKGQAKSPA